MRAEGVVLGICLLVVLLLWQVLAVAPGLVRLAGCGGGETSAAAGGGAREVAGPLLGRGISP